MRFEGSLRIEIFLFGKSIRQEHGTLGREDTMRKAKSVYTSRTGVSLKRLGSLSS